MRLSILFFLFIACGIAKAQNSLPPAVMLIEGNVKDSTSGKPIKVWIKISWGDSSTVIPCDSKGVLNEGAIFYHTSPDSLVITSTNTDYHVSKYKVKKYQQGKVIGENGKATGEMWYMIIINVTVAKEKE